MEPGTESTLCRSPFVWSSWTDRTNLLWQIRTVVVLVSGRASIGLQGAWRNFLGWWRCCLSQQGRGLYQRMHLPKLIHPYTYVLFCCVKIVLLLIRRQYVPLGIMGLGIKGERATNKINIYTVALSGCTVSRCPDQHLRELVLTPAAVSSFPAHRKRFGKPLHSDSFTNLASLPHSVASPKGLLRWGRGWEVCREGAEWPPPAPLVWPLAALKMSFKPR